MSRTWPRIIAHVDMDAFFAQVEQRDFPVLRGRPVCVTNGLEGTCIITRSYEARARGVATGMRLSEARRLCPELVQQPSRPAVYATISSQIMQALHSISPDMEIFSVDEAFLELSRCRGLYRGAKQVAQLIRQRVWHATGLTCSVGVSGDKTTAKFASKRCKPNGMLVVPPWQAATALAPIPVTEICGISKGIAQFLAQYGVHYCGQMAELPIGVLARRYGRVGRRLWYMCLGQDPERLRYSVPAPQRIGHGKVMPPQTQARDVILHFLHHMCEKVGGRLRQNHMTARVFFVGLKTADGWLGQRFKAVVATDDGLLIFQFAKALVAQQWQGEGVFSCQVTALHPQCGAGQRDLFADAPPARQQLNAVVDQVQDKFGQGCLVNATRLKPLVMPDVIAPAWRPEGHRATIAVEKKPKT